MRVAVPKEMAAGEHRVALVPETVAKLGPGFQVRVERGAGEAAGFDDETYADAGAELATSSTLAADAECIACVRSPAPQLVASLSSGTVVVGFLEPLTDAEGIGKLRERGVAAFAMESIPRITRAQSMDALV